MISKYDLRGRKAILAFWGLKKWASVLRRIESGAPIHREPGRRKWIASSEELDAWSVGHFEEISEPRPQ